MLNSQVVFERPRRRHRQHPTLWNGGVIRCRDAAAYTDASADYDAHRDGDRAADHNHAHTGRAGRAAVLVQANANLRAGPGTAYTIRSSALDGEGIVCRLPAGLVVSPVTSSHQGMYGGRSRRANA